MLIEILNSNIEKGPFALLRNKSGAVAAFVAFLTSCSYRQSFLLSTVEPIDYSLLYN